MNEETRALKESENYGLTPIPNNKKIIDGRWV